MHHLTVVAAHRVDPFLIIRKQHDERAQIQADVSARSGPVLDRHVSLAQDLRARGFWSEELDLRT